MTVVMFIAHIFSWVTFSFEEFECRALDYWRAATFDLMLLGGRPVGLAVLIDSGRDGSGAACAALHALSNIRSVPPPI
jgi:hypothetical protein